jgi:uncharacterized protein YoxC
MKTCERGDALVELADRFAITIKELVNEVKYLKQRIELLENSNQISFDVNAPVQKLQEVVDVIGNLD